MLVRMLNQQKKKKNLFGLKRDKNRQDEAGLSSAPQILWTVWGLKSK